MKHVYSNAAELVCNARFQVSLSHSHQPLCPSGGHDGVSKDRAVGIDPSSFGDH